MDSSPPNCDAAFHEKDCDWSNQGCSSSDKIQPLQFWSKARVTGMILLLKMLVAPWTTLLTIKLLFWGGRIASRLKLLGCFLFEIQVQHLSRDHPDFAGWSFQGQACSVLEAVGVRAPFGHRWVRQYFFLQMLTSKLVAYIFKSVFHSLPYSHLL
jgi:hypothetical protein